MENDNEEARGLAYRTAAMRVLDKNTYLRNVPYSDPTTDLDRYASDLADYRGEFTWSATFDPTFIAELMYRGFLPMSTDQGGIAYLLPKLHVERCVMRFKDLHVSKQVRKKAKNFRLSVDRRIDQVVAGINAQHSHDSWFYPELVEAFKTIQEHGGKGGLVRVHSIELWKRVIIIKEEEPQPQQPRQEDEETDRGSGIGLPTKRVDAGGESDSHASDIKRSKADVTPAETNGNNTDTISNVQTSAAAPVAAPVAAPAAAPAAASATQHRASGEVGIKASAIGEETSDDTTVILTESSSHILDTQMVIDGELWELVAGEVGYACGASFTSLSGYSLVNHSGSVQCVALALLLQQSGFAMWDLGMCMEYKAKMGALGLPRPEFINMLTDARDRMDCTLDASEPVDAGVLVKQHFDRLRNELA